MGKIFIVLLATVALSAFTCISNVRAAEDLKANWKGGLNFKSEDGQFKLKVGGRIMADAVFIMGTDEDLENAIGGLEDTVEYRRARIYVSGQIYNSVVYKAEFDFAGQDADLKDVYIGLKNVPFVGNVKVGHIKEPFGLEELTSSKYITFMERSLTSALTPGRNTGVKLNNAVFDKRGTWAVGAYRAVGDSGNSDPDVQAQYNITGRLTAVPVFMEKGRKLVHVGFAVSQRNPDGDSVRYRSRPEIHTTDRFVDTGGFDADGAQHLGGELAVVFGPVSAQGEYIQANVDALVGDGPSFSAYYFMVSFFVTGENRPYKQTAGSFSRVKPNKNFREGNPGMGALELTARYSGIDLTDGAIVGGELSDITLGVNWYLNPNTRVMANYVIADEDVLGSANMFATRFQVDF